MGGAAAPTIDDARRAGQALTDAGAREVMVFGSVAKGEARPYSDIDLVVVFDDLGYRMRRDTAYALEDLAADAVGQPVDVWLTDVPEWAAQNRCAASFAAAIRADLMPVAVRRGDDSAIRWHKEQVMATSDTEAAWRHRPVRQQQDVLESGVRRPGRTCGCPISCRGWSGGMFVFVDEAIAAGRSDESKGQRVVSRVVVGGGVSGWSLV